MKLNTTGKESSQWETVESSKSGTMGPQWEGGYPRKVREAIKRGGLVENDVDYS